MENKHLPALRVPGRARRKNQAHDTSVFLWDLMTRRRIWISPDLLLPVAHSGLQSDRLVRVGFSKSLKVNWAEESCGLAASAATQRHHAGFILLRPSWLIPPQISSVSLQTRGRAHISISSGGHKCQQHHYENDWTRSGRQLMDDKSETRALMMMMIGVQILIWLLISLVFLILILFIYWLTVATSSHD